MRGKKVLHTAKISLILKVFASMALHFGTTHRSIPGSNKCFVATISLILKTDCTRHNLSHHGIDKP